MFPIFWYGVLELNDIKREKRHLIDVVLLTKDSLSRNDPGVFEESLESVKKEIPINRIIIVDAFSEDGTIEMVRQKFQNVEVIQDQALRGKAREIGIKAVETEFFMFVDDDVILSPNWFDKALTYFDDEGVGAVWGVDHFLTEGSRAGAIQLMSKVRRLTQDEIMIRNFKIRGGTHDILIKTEAVKGIFIPEDLHIYEDAWIKEFIERKGLKVLPVSDPWCIHKKPKTKWTWEKGFLLASLEEKYGYLHNHTLYYALRNFILGVPKAMLIYAINRKWDESVKQVAYYTVMLAGCLRAKLSGIKRIDRFELMDKGST